MTDINDYERYAAARQEELQKGSMKPHRFVEKPAMKSILPNLKDKHILLLGCGTGEESILLEEFGATNMIGVDLSEASIKLAQASYPQHTFKVGDMHTLDFEDETFDFVYSSLTIHYSATPEKVYQEIFRVLKPGGQVQFSVGHPMRWASERIELNGVSTKLMGYTEGDEEVRLYGSYSAHKEYAETFPSGEVLSFWVGPPSMYFNLLKNAGFRVDEFIETKAVEETKEADINYYQRFSNFPHFTIFSATKLAN